MKKNIILLILLIFSMAIFSNAILKSNVEQYETIMNKMDTLVTVIRDTTFVHDTIYKEVNRTKYINAISYTNIFSGRIDTLETHKGETAITVQFADGTFSIDNVHEYTILCNGKMYEKPVDEDEPDGDRYNECAGEWIFKIKGER